MQKSRLHRLTWLPWVASAVVAGVVIAGWYILNLQEDERFQKTTIATAQLMEILVRRDIDERVSSLQGLAKRWQLHQGNPPHETWEADASDFFAEQPGYQVIEWVDASMRVVWRTPLQGNGQKHFFDITSTPEALRAALQAKASHQAVLTPLIKGVISDSRLSAYLPLYRDDKFTGLMIGVFRIIPWLDSILAVEDESAYNFRISINNKPVYDSWSETNLDGNSWLEERTFALYGLNWTMQVAPTDTYLNAIHPRLSTAILILGLTLSALMGWIVHSALNEKLQAQRLRSNANRLTTLLKNLPGMAYRYRNQGNWPAEFVSEGCWQLCGFSKSEFEEHRISWHDLVHADDHAKLRKSVENAISNDRGFENEHRIITRQGQEKWVWFRGRVIEAEYDGTAYLEGLITDITSQKQAATALVNAEAYSKAVVDTAAEAVITIDANGRIETFNAAAQQMFRYSLEEIAGENVRVLMPEPGSSGHNDYIRRYLEGHPSRRIGSGRDVTGRRKDGSLFPIRVSVSEVQNQSERKLVGLIRDLSDQRAAEQEAREHRERLAHVDRLNILGEMASGIAHEINQPLSAISMYAQSGIRFLNDVHPKPKRLSEALEKLGMQAHRAGAIIERMQQLSKQRDSQLESIDGNMLIKEVYYLAETEARMRDMIIELDLCPHSRPIMGDPVQIQQVVLNLLRNGMESMESNNDCHGNHIVLSTQCKEEGFTVFVIDRGIGISDEVAERLYQPFSTTKKTGMGLGLSICMSIVRAHGGKLEFTNNDQGGATFYFNLPYSTLENYEQD